jgi:hypothetical protein
MIPAIAADTIRFTVRCIGMTTDGVMAGGDPIFKSLNSFRIDDMPSDAVAELDIQLVELKKKLEQEKSEAR